MSNCWKLPGWSAREGYCASFEDRQLVLPNLEVPKCGACFDLFPFPSTAQSSDDSSSSDEGFTEVLFSKGNNLKKTSLEAALQRGIVGVRLRKGSLVDGGHSTTSRACPATESSTSADDRSADARSAEDGRADATTTTAVGRLPGIVEASGFRFVTQNPHFIPKTRHRQSELVQVETASANPRFDTSVPIVGDDQVGDDQASSTILAEKDAYANPAISRRLVEREA